MTTQFDPSQNHVLLICETCEGVDAASEIAEALARALPAGFRIEPVDCMAGCDRPVTLGFQAPGKAQYLFGDIASGADLGAIADFAGQYAASSDGWTKATERPAALLDKTLSRLPALRPLKPLRREPAI